MKSNHLIEQEELMAYLDGELTTDRAAVAVAHLERCQECQELAAVLRNVSEQMREWQVPEAPEEMPDFGAAFETSGLKEGAALKSDAKRPRHISRLRLPMPGFGMPMSKGWVFGSGAAVAVLLIAVMMSSLSRTQYATRVAEPFFVAPHKEKESVVDQRAENKTFGSRNAATAGLGQSYSVGGHSAAEQQGQLDANREKAGRLETYGSQTAPNVSGPMIIRTAGLSLTTKEFDKARAGLEDVLHRHNGYVGDLSVGGSSDSARTLNAKLRVPADQLDSVMTELKRFGHVDSESQSGEEITQQYVDLQARIDNGKHTEQQLTDILRERTGKLADILSVERETDRVRGEIERMEAERKSLANQVDFATLNISVSEEYKTPIQTVVPLSTSTRLSNAMVDGFKTVMDGFISVLLFLASAGPTLLIWCAILFFPVRAIWRKVRKLRNHAVAEN